MFVTDIEKLREELAKKNKNISDLADYIGVDRSTVYRRLDKNTLQIRDIQKAAEFLELNAEEACAIFLAKQSH